MTEVPEGYDLLEHAKRNARECAESLKDPEEDILPVMLWLGPYGMGIMPLNDGMRNDDTKDALSGVITATLAVSRATEVVMVTTAWMVHADLKHDPESPEARRTRDELLKVRPSENPNRTENVVLMYARVTGEDGIVSAPITRYPDKPPTLGEWDGLPFEPGRERRNPAFGGRFGDAMHLGLDLAKSMPQELIDIIEEGWREGTQDDLMRRFLKVYGSMRGAPQTSVGPMTIQVERN